MIKIKVPGKLLLAGEYAVLVPGSLALGLAVKRYVHLALTISDKYTIQSDLLPEPWSVLHKRDLDPTRCPVELGFAVSALAFGLAYLAELGHDLPCLHLRLESELNDHSIKLGLGSSGAVCVAVIAALLVWIGEDISLPEQRLRIYKLAVLAHRAVQGNGSGVDIATSILGSVTAYTAPDFQILSRPGCALQALVEKLDWPMLGLEKVASTQQNAFAIGWTGSPAYSGDWVRYFMDWRAQEPVSAAQFLFDSNANTLALREALICGDLSQQIQGLARARRILDVFNQDFPLEPETPELAALADTAQSLGGAGKFSGAGGGDCGIALVPELKKADLLKAWSEAGIQSLDLELDTVGVVRM